MRHVFNTDMQCIFSTSLSVRLICTANMTQLFQLFLRVCLHFSDSLYLKTYDLLSENSYRNSEFDLSNISLLNENFCVAQDAMDTKGFGTPTEMPMSLMLHPSINK